jgi:putative ABC transport system permease protein
MRFLLHIFDSWCWRMAWRDSRRARARLLGFSVAIMAGIAALVMVGSLRDSLLRALDGEARAMLGADAYLFAKRPVSEKAEALLKEQPCQVLKETAFTAMARVVSRDSEAKLVQARAVDSGWPFFGKPTTEPADAWERCLAGEGLVVDGVLEETLALRIGDRLKLGDLELPVLGVLRRPPPQVSLMGQFAPEMFLALRLTPQSALDENAAGTFHRRWLLFPDGYDVEKQFVDKLKKPLRTEGVNVESVAERKKSITFVLNTINSFLSLMAFIALVLGGLGVASAIHVHATGRLPVVATLRCLGCTADRALAVYVIQGLWMGLAGAIGGVALGAGAVYGAAAMLQGIVPVPVEARVSLLIAGQALLFGFLLCVSFALLPLLQVRRMPAMAAVRANVISTGSRWREPLTWGVLLLVAAALVWLAVALSPPGMKMLGVGFCVALAVGFLLLACAAWLIMRLARKIIRPGWPFTLRMGLAGLHRPRNQTLLFLLSVGTGVAMVLATLLTEGMLTRYLSSWDVRMKANFFAINIAPEQRTAATDALRRAGAELIGEAPVAMFSLQGVDGKSLDELQDQKGRRRIGGWFLTHIYRVSWDPALPQAAPGEKIGVSVEKSLSETFRVKTGSTLSFNHAGKTIECVVRDIHEADIEKMLDNFPFLIKDRVPADLYVTWAAGAHIRNAAHGVRVQRELTAAVPGATIFDIAAISVVVEKLISRGARVIHWLSLLTVFTGLIIVVAVLLAGRRDRVEESVLLRTLGASRGQIRRILITEYLLLGLFAFLTGALLSMGFAWLLAWLVFEIPFDTWHWPLAAAVALVCALTAALGMALSRGVAGHPPLAILRGDG